MKFDKSKLKTQLAEVATVKDILTACYGNQAECARLVGVNRGTMRSWVKSGKDISLTVDRSGGEIKFSNPCAFNSKPTTNKEFNNLTGLESRIFDCKM